MTNYTSQPIIFILVTIVSFIQFALILRLLFEIMRVNFYNPVCQVIIKITDPILRPLRLIPLICWESRPSCNNTSDGRYSI